MDDTGQTVRLAQPAKRIISLSPDLTEDLFYIGAGAQIVGVMQGSDYPIEAKNIPIVATYNSIDREVILALQPDLIIVWAETSLLPVIKKLNIPVYVSYPHTISDIANTLKKLGELTGRSKTASERANVWMKDFLDLQASNKNKKEISVFYQVWSNPLLTVNDKSWISTVISLCGGKNIFGKLKGTAPEVNVEEVIIRNPDMMAATHPPQQWQTQWQRWHYLTAVKHKHLFTITADTLERPSPRLINGAREMCLFMDVVRNKSI